MLTVQELRELIEDLPDDMEVCGCGYFGEPLEIYRAAVGPVSHREDEQRALVIDMENAGEEPD